MMSDPFTLTAAVDRCRVLVTTHRLTVFRVLFLMYEMSQDLRNMSENLIFLWHRTPPRSRATFRIILLVLQEGKVQQFEPNALQRIVRQRNVQFVK